MTDVFFVACIIAGVLVGAAGAHLSTRVQSWLGELKGPRSGVVPALVGMWSGALVAILLEFLWNKVTSGAFCGLAVADRTTIATGLCSYYSWH